jgi:hypothetical protein
MAKKQSTGKLFKKKSSAKGFQRLGKKTLTEAGAENVHKMKETRRHRTGGRPGGRPHHAG